MNKSTRMKKLAAQLSEQKKTVRNSAAGSASQRNLENEVENPLALEARRRAIAKLKTFLDG